MNFDIHHGNDDQLPSLSKSDRLSIATETFNFTLKQLGEAVKVQNGNSASAATSKTPLHFSESDNTLQQRSPNRVAKLTFTDSKEPKTKATSSDFELVAECSFSALQYLQKEKVESSANKNPGLENAALILLDRSISLGLAALAERQMSDIHHKCMKCNASRNGSANSGIAKFLLGRSDAANDNSSFGFTASMQSQAIRLALLLGPKCISQEFLRSLQLDTVGSPTWTILQGLEKRRHTVQQAGLQLRTISLALSRLYTLALKSEPEDRSRIALFDLFCLSLRIKFESWAHLCHKILPATEVWRPLQNAVKQLFISTEDSITLSPHLCQSLSVIRECLGVAKCETEIPVEVTEVVLRTLHASDACAETLVLMEESLQRSRDARLSLQCQITTVWLKNSLCRHPEALSSVRSIKRALDGTNAIPLTELGQLLLYLAQLRNAATELILYAERKEHVLGDEHHADDLRSELVYLTYASVKFLCRPMARTLMDTVDPSCRENQKAFLVTLMKTIDAALILEQCTITKTSRLVQPAWETLKNCSTAVLDLQTKHTGAIVQNSVQAQCNQLRMRISQALWSRYLAAVKEGWSPLEKAKILDVSLEGLFELPSGVQGAAHVALKYEKLASCYLETHDFALAKSALRNAICVSIKHGILNDVVEMLLANSSLYAWSEPSCKALGKLLVTYATRALALGSPTGNISCFYDDESLPAVHRATLLEKQICAIAELCVDKGQIDLCAGTVKVLFSLLRQPEYHVHMLRTVNCLLHVSLKKKASNSSMLLDRALVQDILSRETAAKEVLFLRKYETEQRSLMYLQYAFFTGQITPGELDKVVHQLCDILRACKDLEEVQAVFDDIQPHVGPLLLAIDYATLIGKPEIALTALEALQRMADLGVIAPELSKSGILVRQGKIHLLLQDVQGAGQMLKMAEKTLDRENADSLFKIEFALAYSEYYLQIQHGHESLSWLRQAQTAWGHRNTSDTSSSTKTKLKEQSILCRAAHLASRLAYEQNQLMEAICLARQSAKIGATLWSSIEKLWISATPLQSVALVDSDSHNLSAEFSKLEISSPTLPQFTASKVIHAPHVSLCCTVFDHMAFLNAHCGIYSDAAMYREQALKIAKKTGQGTQVAVLLSDLVLLDARAGLFQKAQDGLQELSHLAKNSTADWSRALISINQGETHFLLGDRSSALEFLTGAKQSHEDKFTHAVEPVACQLQKGTVKNPNVKTPASKRLKKQQRGNPLPDHPMKESPPIPYSTSDLRDIHAKVSALEARLLSLEDHAQGSDLSGAALDCNEKSDGREIMALVMVLVRSALKSLSTDAVHSILAETALALPVRYRSGRQSGRVSFIQANTSLTLPDEKTGKLKQGSRRKQTRNDSLIHGTRLLLQAYDVLQTTISSQPHRLPSDVLHISHKALTQITLLSTGLDQSLLSSTTELILDITSPLDVVRQRERLITLGEINAAKRCNMQEWPMVEENDGNSMSLSSDQTGKEDLDLLPVSWAIICMELNADKNELFVARVTHEKSPFVVRIPLARPDLQEGENDELSVKSAKAEMQWIMMKASSTAHDARGSSVDKTVRAAWYTERQDLDQQLATLLENMENIWLGGFRGLLSPAGGDEGSLVKFGQSLLTTLNRHLPSRQKTSKSLDSVVELHDHVLELFVGLGNPGEIELEDAITDLVYFVIDVLQFNGERNAYDEIDFDAILVEVLDALYAYHDSETACERKSQHLILVLDKELQVFPWESLPCLRGQAVSRMPSMGSIWERLRTIRGQSSNFEGHVLPRTNGAYILNPASDLKSTQATFERLFQDQLPGYRAIVNRPPVEDEFEAALKEKSLMLYFGHGGARQYTRPRTIRKMEKCAVTLLMGCSSAKLTECGVYEPYGMPLDYLSGGSPAVVGALWDVTDRDIDRFALELIAGWGLIEETDSSGAWGNSKSRGRAKVKASHSERQKQGPISLDQAVADARDACWLKYLNGAAPVMYGIPVFLD